MSVTAIRPLDEDPFVPPRPIFDEKIPTVAECRAVLDPNCLERFDRLSISSKRLCDFVFLLDILHEIVTDKNFLSGYLLNSPDTVHYGREAFSAFKTCSRDLAVPNPPPISVSQHVLDLQAELFEFGYPESLRRILRACRVPGIDVTLDNHTKAYIGLTTKTVHPKFGILLYQDLGTGANASIPFLLERLEGE